MTKVNPYRSPQGLCDQAREVQDGETYSARLCPHCHAAITIWTSIKQTTPFRFKCPQCNSLSRVYTPLMRLIFVGVLCGTPLCVLGIAVVVMMFGLVILSTAVPLLFMAWLALEIWTHYYIARNGRLQLIDSGRRDV